MKGVQDRHPEAGAGPAVSPVQAETTKVDKPSVGEAIDSAAAAKVAGGPKKRRFRWGCFFIVNFFTMLVVLLLLLLFWPVPKEAKRPEQAKNPSVISEGGAEIEVLSVERLGTPRFYFGPGKENFERILLTARTTNRTKVAHAVDLNMFLMRDGYKAQYRPKPDETQYWYEQQKAEPPWDQPVEPGESVTVKAVFVVQLPEKGLRLFVRKGFDWNSLTYIPVAFSMKREQKEIRRESPTSAAEDEVKDVGEVRFLRKKRDLR